MAKRKYNSTNRVGKKRGKYYKSYEKEYNNLKKYLMKKYNLSESDFETKIMTKEEFKQTKTAIINDLGSEIENKIDKYLAERDLEDIHINTATSLLNGIKENLKMNEYGEVDFLKGRISDKDYRNFISQFYNNGVLNEEELLESIRYSRNNKIFDIIREYNNKLKLRGIDDPKERQKYIAVTFFGSPE